MGPGSLRKCLISPGNVSPDLQFSKNMPLICASHCMSIYFCYFQPVLLKTCVRIGGLQITGPEIQHWLRER